MKLFRMSQSLWWLATLVSYGSAISLLEVLQTYPQLSSLSSLVNGSSTATALLASSNNFTFLAPSNDAISAFNSQNPGVLNRSLLANVQYGLLKGGFPTLSISKTPQFIASNLSNATYANVTGGQAVELVLSSDGTPEVLTGNKTISTSTSTDILCVGGIIHVINSVLSIPVAAVLEITNAQLEYFISILNTAGYLSASATYVNQVLEVPDVTFFIPNSAAALANATQLASNSSQEMEAIFQYHVVPGFVGYSTRLTNGMSLKTSEGSNLTVTIQDGDMYINAAKVIESDLIIANGVMHVIDDLLNPSDTSPPPKPTTSSTITSTPAPTSTQGLLTTSTSTQASSSHSGLSTGAKAGIGVGAAVGGLALALLAFLLLRYRKQKRDASPPWDNSSMSGATASPFNRFYVQRGTVQRQEDLGLGLQSSGMHAEDAGIGIAGREYGTGGGVDGPSIPPRSPSRALRGDGKTYF